MAAFMTDVQKWQEETVGLQIARRRTALLAVEFSGNLFDRRVNDTSTQSCNF